MSGHLLWTLNWCMKRSPSRACSPQGRIAAKREHSRRLPDISVAKHLAPADQSWK
jgi:hypothetical protein